MVAAEPVDWWSGRLHEPAGNGQRGLQHEQANLPRGACAVVVEAAVLIVHLAPQLSALLALGDSRAHLPPVTADLDLRNRVRLQIERPRRRGLVPGVRSDHDQALTVGEIHHRYGARCSRAATDRREQQHRRAGDLPEQPPAAGAVERDVELAEGLQRPGRGRRETRIQAIAGHLLSIPAMLVYVALP